MIYDETGLVSCCNMRSLLHNSVNYIEMISYDTLGHDNVSSLHQSLERQNTFLRELVYVVKKWSTQLPREVRFFVMVMLCYVMLCSGMVWYGMLSYVLLHYYAWFCYGMHCHVISIRFVSI